MAENIAENHGALEPDDDDYQYILRRLTEIADRYDNEYNEYPNSLSAQVGRELGRIGDELQANERSELVRLIGDISNVSTASDRTYMAFVILIRKFVLLVSNQVRISAEAAQAFIRLFLQMWSNRALSNQVKEIFDEEPNYFRGNVPSEVKNMNSEFIELYHQALKQGYHQVKDIRLMIVGMFGVGKTSLVNNIVEGDEYEETARNAIRPESTVGIDVIYCDVLNDGRWLKSYNASYANDKLFNILIQSKMSDNIDGSKISNQTSPSSEQELNTETNTSKSHGGNGSESCALDTQNAGTDLTGFREKLSSINHPLFESFMDEVTKMLDDPEEASLSETRVAVWDFAGQNIYYSTHHFFLNSRSIYLLLMDVSKPLNSCVKEITDFPISGFIHKDFTCLEAFKFWLRSIYMYHSMQVSDSSIKPSVILVGTHKDELEGNDDEKEKLKEDFFMEALKSFIDSPILDLVMRRKFLVNNLSDEEDYASIRQEVLNTAKDQYYWNELRPTKWIPLERSLESFKAEGKEIISFDELREEDQKNEMPLDNDSDLKSFLRFQHSVGNVLFFETELLQKWIILSPQWIIDAFRCFISHMPNKDPKLLRLWDDYEQRAILHYELIDEIIDKNPENECFSDFKAEIIEYMELLDMIAKPVDVLDYDQLIEGFNGDHPQQNLNDQSKSGQSLDSSTSEPKEDFYIVPILLRSRPEERKLTNWLNPSQVKSKTPVLAMVFKDGFLPPSVFHRLLAICIRKWPIQKTGGQYMLYNGFAGFRITKTSTLTIWFQDNIVYGRVCCYNNENDTKQLCVEARHFLSNSLISILSIMPNKGGFGEVVPFDEYIQCQSIATFKPGIGLIRLRDFLYHDSILCEDCDEEHAVSKIEGLGLWCSDLLQKQAAGSTTLSDYDLNRCPTPQEFVRMALKCIGDEYFMLGLELGISGKRLEQIRDMDRFHVPTRIYHMLVEAKSLMERNGSKLSIQILRNGMIAVGTDIEAYDDLFLESDNVDANDISEVDIDKLNECPSDITLSGLTKCIGQEYWLLGIMLGISEIRLQQLQKEFRNIPLISYQMLIEWKSKTDSVTKSTLFNAMKIVGSNCLGLIE